MGYTQSCLEELRSRIDLPQFLEGYLEFKRSGSQFKARCPFHQEKSPSFMVRRGDRHYHCFGCGAHGDAISFLVQHQGMRFQEAVELLAERYGVQLENEQSPQDRDARKRAYFVMEKATLFFEEQLQKSAQAKRYLLERSLPKQRWSEYRLGYAPSSSYALKKHLNSLKISDQEMLALGLLRESESGRARDFFTHRLVFPVLDTMARPVAFSARAIDSDYFGGKYINSPETLLFKKSRTLYGLSHTRPAITKQRKVLLVEGQFDAIALIEAGLNFAVCALGTAFGSEHAQEIKRLGVEKAYIVFDSDQAGQNASIKAGFALHSCGIDVLVCTLAEGSDPDQFISDQGAMAMIDCLNRAAPFLEFWVHKEGGQVNLSSPAAKVALMRQIAAQIESIEDPLLRHESLVHLTQLLQLPPEAVASLQTGSKKPSKKKPGPTNTSSPVVEPKGLYDGIEADLLRWLLHPCDDRKLFWSITEKYIGEDESDLFFTHKALKWLYLWLRTRAAQEDIGSLSDLMMALPNDKARSFVSDLLAKRMDHERAQTLFTATLNDLIRRKWRWHLQEIREKLSNAQMDEETALQVAREYSQKWQSEPELLQEALLFPQEQDRCSN